MVRMPPASYEAMKSRLRKLLSEWGLWTDSELDRVAEFVEHEIIHYVIQSQATTNEPSKPPRRK